MGVVGVVGEVVVVVGIGVGVVGVLVVVVVSGVGVDSSNHSNNIGNGKYLYRDDDDCYWHH